MRLPRELETDPRRAAIEAALVRDVRPLRPEGAVSVPHLPITPALHGAIALALAAKHLDRGLDQIEGRLRREKLGLEAARTRQGAPPADRVSRLLLVSGDGADRFYRDCEQTLRHHADRLLCVKVLATAEELAGDLFGTGAVARALLVFDRGSVARVLRAIDPEAR